MGNKLLMHIRLPDVDCAWIHKLVALFKDVMSHHLITFCPRKLYVLKVILDKDFSKCNSALIFGVTKLKRISKFIQLSFPNHVSFRYKEQLRNLKIPECSLTWMWRQAVPRIWHSVCLNKWSDGEMMWGEQGDFKWKGPE